MAARKTVAGRYKNTTGLTDEALDKFTDRLMSAIDRFVEIQPEVAFFMALVPEERDVMAKEASLALASGFLRGLVKDGFTVTFA